MLVFDSQALTKEEFMDEKWFFKLVDCLLEVGTHRFSTFVFVVEAKTKGEAIMKIDELVEKHLNHGEILIIRSPFEPPKGHYRTRGMALYLGRMERRTQIFGDKISET